MSHVITKVDKLLTNFRLSYVQKREAFIADKIFKKSMVTDVTGYYYELARQAQKLWQTEWEPGTKKRQIHWSASTVAYDVTYHGLKDTYTNLDLKKFKEINLKRSKVTNLTEAVLVKKEYTAATKAFTAANYETGYTSALTGGDMWDQESANVIQNIIDGQYTVLKGCNNLGNTLIIGAEVAQKMFNNADVATRIQYTKGATPTAADLIRLCPGLQNVYIGMSLYDNTTIKATESATPTFLWGKAALVCYIPDSVELETPAYGVQWSDPDYNGQVRSFFDNDLEAYVVDIKDSYSFAFKCIDNSTDKDSVAGYLYTTVVS